jgi:5-methylcytosine-specific restriction endonuclease McrA
MPRRPNRLKNKRKSKKATKKAIPKAIREQCWIKTFGEKYKSKCFISWCENEISVFDFHVGHDKPESHGGTLDINNLKPICARCNLSMSNKFTIKQWNKLSEKSNTCCIIS